MNPLQYAKEYVMKVLSVADATTRLEAVCTEAFGGEVIMLRREDGSFLELIPAACPPRIISDQELAASYIDTEWAEFENRCCNASG